MFIWTTRTILVFGKKSPWYGKTLPKKRILGKSHFLRLSGTLINSSGVSSQTKSYVRMLPQGFYFWQINISGILRHAHFEEIGLLLIFGHSGDPQETLRRHLPALWRHLVSQISLGRKMCWQTGGGLSAAAPRQLHGSPRGTKCARSWELGNTVRSPQCKHCLGN